MGSVGAGNGEEGDGRRQNRELGTVAGGGWRQQRGRLHGRRCWDARFLGSSRAAAGRRRLEADMEEEFRRQISWHGRLRVVPDWWSTGRGSSGEHDRRANQRMEVDQREGRTAVGSWRLARRIQRGSTEALAGRGAAGGDSTAELGAGVGRCRRMGFLPVRRKLWLHGRLGKRGWRSAGGRGGSGRPGTGDGGDGEGTDGGGGLGCGWVRCRKWGKGREWRQPLGVEDGLGGTAMDRAVNGGLVWRRGGLRRSGRCWGSVPRRR